MAVRMTEDTLLTVLQNKATQLRIDSVRATSEAGSGHPSSCTSAADIVATLFFSIMRYDPKHPKHPANDRFILSKGHAAPLLYAAWAEVGLFDRNDLLRLRTLGSDLEGHPTPRLPFVDLGDRFIRTRPAGRGRHGIERQAIGSFACTDVCLDGRRRVGGRLRMGGG